ncbi:immunity protein YezG family protein [Nocardiopsis alborubida]|nr:hypothetical protein [Nocardiopsis alborubida]
MTFPPKKGISITEQQSIVQRMGVEIASSTPGDWAEISYRYSSLHDTAASIAKVTYKNGETERKNSSTEAMDLADQLRYGMYQDSKGAWFSLTYKILQSGQYNVHFNYDERPSFLFPPSPEEYAADLEEFPRDPEHIPEWLREELRKAEQD